MTMSRWQEITSQQQHSTEDNNNSMKKCQCAKDSRRRWHSKFFLSPVPFTTKLFSWNINKPIQGTTTTNSALNTHSLIYHTHTRVTALVPSAKRKWIIVSQSHITNTRGRENPWWQQEHEDNEWAQEKQLLMTTMTMTTTTTKTTNDNSIKSKSYWHDHCKDHALTLFSGCWTNISLISLFYQPY